jgi:hypothetical protein
MRNWKTTLLIGLTVFGLVDSANAAFSFNGPAGTPPVGAYLDIKLTNFEILLEKWEGSASQAAGNVRYSDRDILTRKISGGVPTTVGQEIYGIAVVTSIKNNVSGAVYWNPATNQELAFRFYGFELATTAGLPGTSTWTGGSVDMFFDSVPDYDSSTGPFLNTNTGAGSGWDSVTVAGSNNTTAHLGIATWNGVGDAGDSVFMNMAAVQGKTATPGETLTTTFNLLSASDVEGVGSSFLESLYSAFFLIAKDEFNSQANAATQAGNQDLNLLSNFDNRSTAGALFQPLVGWTLQSEDPVSFKFNGVVPEPASVLVWGALGLLGLAFSRRRVVCRGK